MKRSEKSLFILVAFSCLFWTACTYQASTGGQRAQMPYENYLSHINPAFMVTPDEAKRWHVVKDKEGPTYSGSPSWQSYVAFIEKKLNQYGVVDITKNKWTYDRWFTSEWPDDSNWTLVSDGNSVKVAHYGAYSGSTGPEGVIADLALYTPKTPMETLKGKIVVFMTAPHPRPPLEAEYKKWFTLNDFEYRSEIGDLPPLFTQIPPGESVSYDVWWQLRQTILVYRVLKKSQAAGGIVIFNMGYDRLAGLYTFPVMPFYNVPTLYVDRNAGKKLIQDAKQGKKASLKLLAKVEPTETYQLIGYLPGKHYGTDRDEAILLTTHTDGPAVLQDNGALGLLGIVAYFSRIPQADRPRTLMLHLDNRHYMPGMERAFAKEDYFAKNPDAKSSIVGLIATEHLGQIEFREANNVYEPTGNVEPSFLWTRNDQRLIDMAIKAVKQHQWPRVLVQCVERPGSHGGPQGVWYGMGKIALDWDLPAFATMGTQGAYWSTTARIDTFNKDQFVTQVAAMAQLTGELMKADLKKK
ncbi:MAG: hypothetical protein JSU83_23155 [Deltaproteobacteria bacterium]|nr:MAG: hypothetical protein JSU83_23155 [Deltaproteobacteria bacterium]